MPSNCKNCGAPLDLRKQRCDYCKTYFVAPNKETPVADKLPELHGAADQLNSVQKLFEQNPRLFLILGAGLLLNQVR